MATALSSITGERVFLFTSQTQSLHTNLNPPRHQRERNRSGLVPRHPERILRLLIFLPLQELVKKTIQVPRSRKNGGIGNRRKLPLLYQAAAMLPRPCPIAAANSPDSPAPCIATRIYNHVTIAYREPEHHYIASWNGKLPWSIVLLRAQWLARPARTIQGGSVCSVRRMLSRFASASQ